MNTILLRKACTPISLHLVVQYRMQPASPQSTPETQPGTVGMLNTEPISNPDMPDDFITGATYEDSSL